ncbi:D-glucuronyl C5-epimerase family protein [Neobacillus sp. NPDC058068]|uniref:D-glucuronyl C5-epimerase family protein n=1 Tax=Neobacillus sp. NPDC058068 TaxID=3346325 RepID=UPI0036DBD097
MSLSIFKLKKWLNMLNGKSILHVNQGIGKIYSKSGIKGYYNDLTEKVTKGDNLNEVKLPILELEDGSKVLFPIAIFQYGLGSYDLYLLENKQLYLNKFKLCVDWAINNQQKDGSWSNFFFVHSNAPYSAMAQGEGVSLLLRAYKEFNDEKYLFGAKKAIDFLLTPLDLGGTTKYFNGEVFLQEYTNEPTVLNGWIFAIFGLFDYFKVSEDKRIKELLDKTLESLEAHLSEFDNGYWSMYDLGGRITSPFYHKLHIAQLEVLYDIFRNELFKEYSERWHKYQNNWFKRKHAFIVKVCQKLTEK